MFNVVELFGPTIQGEGHLAGKISHFIRLGGCTYRCAWCDSMHAVDPDLIKENSRSLSAGEILHDINNLGWQNCWVTITGGDPHIYGKKIADLVSLLKQCGYKVAIETQGAFFIDYSRGGWPDLLTVSPKPPSSGEKANFKTLDRFLAAPSERLVFKIVVADQGDFEFAKLVYNRYIGIVPTWITPCTPQEGSVEENTVEILRNMRTICNKIFLDPTLKNMAVMPQLHYLIWGRKKGV